MLVAIVADNIWFLNFVHVFSGVLWTGIDLYLGFVLGPTMRKLELPVRRTITANLTPRTKAVIAVHLFGNIAPVAEIEALGVPVLEDAAQSAGSTGAHGRPGSLATAATFSAWAGVYRGTAPAAAAASLQAVRSQTARL